MKIILKEEVESLGYPGDIVDVRNGYGRNYLIPRGKAMLATPGAVKDRSRQHRLTEVSELRRRGEFEELAAALNDKVVTVRKRAGSGIKLYGSVTTADIAEALLEQHGLEIERKRLTLEAPVKTLGSHEVTVRVSTGVEARLAVEVLADRVEPEAEEQDDEAAAEAEGADLLEDNSEAFTI